MRSLKTKADGREMARGVGLTLLFRRDSHSLLILSDLDQQSA